MRTFTEIAKLKYRGEKAMIIFAASRNSKFGGREVEADV